MLERVRLLAAQAVAELEHLAVALGERLEGPVERLLLQPALGQLLRKRVVAGHEVAEDRVLLLADRLVEARGRPCGRTDLERLLKRKPGLLGDLLERGLAAEVGEEVALGALHLLHPLDDVDGDADRPRLVRNRTSDGLADPPGRVRRELEPAAPFELLDGADEPEHAFLDEIEEGEALVAVVLGDRDDQAQVGLDHPLLGRHVAALDALRELDLLGGGEQRVTADLAQEELQRVRGRLHVRVEVARGRRRLLHGLLRRGLRDLVAAVLELLVERVDVALFELERVHGLGQLAAVHDTTRLRLLENRLEFVYVQQRAAFLRHEAA